MQRSIVHNVQRSVVSRDDQKITSKRNFLSDPECYCIGTCYFGSLLSSMDMLYYLKTVLLTIHFLIHLKRDIQSNKSSFVIVYEHVCSHSCLYYNVSPLGKKKPNTNLLCSVLRVKYHLHDGTDFYYWYLQYPDTSVCSLWYR